jgi:hypothetical protein
MCVDAESISMKFRRKKMKTTGVIVIALAMLIALTGVVMADQVVPAVPETQTISTSTAIIADGLVTDSAGLAWTLSNQSITAIPPLADSQIVYTTAYDASTVAQAGTTTFVKTMAVDTRNKVIGQSNVNADTAVTFIATADGGNIVGSENLLIDGAGNYTTASDRMLCPFAAATGNVIPQYCNIVQAGSKYDLTVGSVTTAADDRFVGTDATNPVVLNYAINVKPYGTTAGQIPAIGSAMAYVKAHIQEGRTNTTVKDEDLTYSETSAVTGTISSFQKVIAYQSGKALL